MMSPRAKDVFPYQDQSLKNRKGERWTAVPGFEDAYEVSSVGRIRSLSRESALPSGGTLPVRERVLKLYISTAKNKLVGDELYTLMTTLSKDGSKYYFSVGRLVYAAFVEAFPLKDPNVYISYKDGNSLNLDYRNLYRTDISELKRKAHDTGRAEAYNRKPVSQFDTCGNLVAQYGSCQEAADATGYGAGSIAGATTGKSRLCHGYIWQSGKSTRLRKDALPKQVDNGINIPLQQLIRKTGEKKTHLPATDLRVGSLKGERWKDIAGYEGLYRISCFGRIKSLARVSENNQWHPECIKKLTPKRVSGAMGFNLAVTLSKDKKKKAISVARHVYYTFVKEFPLDDVSLRVYFRDGKPYNLHYRNLELKNSSWSILKKSP